MITIFLFHLRMNMPTIAISYYETSLAHLSDDYCRPLLFYCFLLWIKISATS